MLYTVREGRGNKRSLSERGSRTRRKGVVLKPGKTNGKGQIISCWQGTSHQSAHQAGTRETRENRDASIERREKKGGTSNNTETTSVMRLRLVPLPPTVGDLPLSGRRLNRIRGVSIQRKGLGMKNPIQMCGAFLSAFSSGLKTVCSSLANCHVMPCQAMGYETLEARTSELKGSTAPFPCYIESRGSEQGEAIYHEPNQRMA